MEHEKLPSFEEPPVVEVLLTVQFEPLPKFSNAHLGLFWSEIGKEHWPESNDTPIVPPTFEKFGEELTGGPQGTLAVAYSQAGLSRSVFVNANKDRMLQIQNGRLIYNWIKTRGRPYARYNSIYREFENLLKKLISFCRKNSLGQFRPNQWEVNYINHMPCNTVWCAPADWTKVFRGNAVLPAVVRKATLESCYGLWSYEIVPRQGRLHVHLQSGKDNDSKDILVFSLLTRGPIQSRRTRNAVTAIRFSLDLGHKTIVNAFSDLTSEEAKSYWKEQR